MAKFTRLLNNLPEYYLLGGVLLYGYSPSFDINPIAVILAIILILQIIYRNKFSGIIIGCLFFLINIFFLAALASEVNEFPTFNAEAQMLHYGGVSIFGGNLALACFMVYKYAFKENWDEPQSPLSA